MNKTLQAMKIHKYIPILLLLIFASSYCGLAQTDAPKPGLPDEEVIKLRKQIEKQIFSNRFAFALNTAHTLINYQQNDWEYISQREYWSLLLLTLEFDDLIVSCQKKPEDTHSKFQFEPMDSLLIVKLKQFEKGISPLIEIHELTFNEKTIIRSILSAIVDQESSLEITYISEAALIKSHERSQIKNKTKKSHRVKEKKKSYEMETHVYGLGLGVNGGFYSGDIAEYVKSYSNFFTLDLYLRIWRFDSNLCLGFGTTSPINKINFYGENISGDFTGDSFCGSFKLGYLVYSGSSLEIIPNLGYFGNTHNVSAKVQQTEEQITGIRFDGFSSGITINIPIFSIKYSSSKKPWLMLSSKYDFLLGIKKGDANDPTAIEAIPDQYVKGFGHQFSVGIMYVY